MPPMTSSRTYTASEAPRDGIVPRGNWTVARASLIGTRRPRCGTPGYATFVAGSRDARRIVVISVNGISQDALHAMGLYLDKLLCPR